MTYSFARVSAVTGMRVKDYRQGQKKRMEFHLHEKGGKKHTVPAHHRAVEYMEDYLDAMGLREDKKYRNTPLFRTAYRKTGLLTENGITRSDVFRMIKRRAKAAGLPSDSVLSYVPRHRHHGLSEERGGVGESAGDSRA